MNYYYLAASFISLVVWAAHTFGGGPQVAKPLLESSMEDVPKYTNYYCWHLITGVLFLNALGYGYLSFDTKARELAIFITLCVLFSMLWSLALNAIFRLSWVSFPQWLLFLAVLVPAVLGLL